MKEEKKKNLSLLRKGRYRTPRTREEGSEFLWRKKGNFRRSESHFHRREGGGEGGFFHLCVRRGKKKGGEGKRRPLSHRRERIVCIWRKEEGKGESETASYGRKGKEGGRKPYFIDVVSSIRKRKKAGRVWPKGGRKKQARRLLYAKRKKGGGGKRGEKKQSYYLYRGEE